MSNSHDPEPDQAALDELMRAFAEDEDAFDIDEIAIVEQDPLPAHATPEHGDGPGPDDTVARARADRHDRGVGEAPDDAIHAVVDDVTAGESATDEVSVDEAVADEVRVDDARVDEVRVDEAVADEERVDDARVDDFTAEEANDAVVADDRSGEVESALPKRTPSIIRIDDYAGSEEIAPTDAAQATTSTGDSLDAAGDGGIISIDDADRPDPVYVEGSLDRDGSRTIVFIEDDDTGDTLAPESERDVRRGIEPRLRERRRAVKRAKGRKRLRWLVVGAVVAFVGVGVLAVLGSSLFAIEADQVSLTGNRYADEAMLDEVIDDLIGTPVLRVDTQAAERALEAIPWIDEAVVRTDFPHGVTIEIRERAAMTTYQGPDGRFRVLDEEGRVLDVIDGYPIAYVLLGGPDPVDLEPGEFAPQGYAAASQLAKNLTGSVRQPGRVQMIEVTADGSRLSMHLDDGTEVRFGEARDILAKLVRLETVLTSGDALEPTDALEPGVIDISTSEVTR